MQELAKAALALGTIAVTGSPVSAQAGRPSQVTLPRTEIHAIHSPQVGSDFELWIAEPVPGMRGLPDAPLGVLYLLDANLYFGTAVEMTRLMHQLYGELPPLLVVGIAYPTSDPALQAELRARDFTPTSDVAFEESTRSFPGAAEPTLPAGNRLGGATTFLSFLQETVRPYVESRFEVAPGRSSLWGSSLGGLFTLFAMLEEPASFDAYLATSPAIWWDDNYLLRLERQAERRQRPLPTRLVLSVGAEEERTDIPMLAQFKMVSNVRTLAERLDSWNHAAPVVTTHVLDGETHTSVVPPALTRSLRDIYGPRRPRQ